VSAILQCACGHRVEVKDELAGRSIKCPNCGTPNTAMAADQVGPPTGDTAFQQDKYLLKQQLLTIAEKYDIATEQGSVILFAERPRHLARGMLAALVGVIVFFGMIWGGIVIAESFVTPTGPHPVADVVGVVVLLLAFPATIAAIIVLSPLRHTTLYRDESRGEKLLEIRQDQKVALINATFTVRDGAGKVIAKFRKNYLYNFIRKRWHVLSPSGTLLFVAMEDSIMLSLLRRLLGPLFGLLRTNFIIRQGGEEGSTIGEFNRKMTLFDKYVLDLSADRLRVLDRRLAVALGVMLDTGERR
jgi:hypothetical protein